MRRSILSGTGIFGTGALLNAAGNNAWNGPIIFDILPGFSPDTFPFGAVSINVAGLGDTLTLGGPIGEFAPTGLTKIGLGELVLTAPTATPAPPRSCRALSMSAIRRALGTRSGTASVQRIITVSAAREGTFTLTFNGAIDDGPVGRVRRRCPRGASIAPDDRLGEHRLRDARGSPDDDARRPRGSSNRVRLHGHLRRHAGEYAVLPRSAGAGGTAASATSLVARGGIDVRVAYGAALELDTTGTPSSGFTVAGHKLTLGGTGVNGHGALDNIAGSNTWAGPIEMAAHTSVGANASTALALSGGISGAAFDLTKVDPGTVIFPTGGNNQTRTIINAGTVEVDGSLGRGPPGRRSIGGTGTVGAISSTPARAGRSTRASRSRRPDRHAHGVGRSLNSSNTFFVDLATPSAARSTMCCNSRATSLWATHRLRPSRDERGHRRQFTIIQATCRHDRRPVQTGPAGQDDVYIDNKKFVVQYLAEQRRPDPPAGQRIDGPGEDDRIAGLRRAGTIRRHAPPESPNMAVSGTVIFSVTDPDNNHFLFPVAINPADQHGRLDPSVATRLRQAARDSALTRSPPATMASIRTASWPSTRPPPAPSRPR